MRCPACPALRLTPRRYRCPPLRRQTGRKGNKYALEVLQPALQARGFTVFCYCAELQKGDAWVSVLTDGIEACRAFIPVCSPTYADLAQSPWTSNELFFAARTAAKREAAAAAAAAAGAASPDAEAPRGPHILPFWFSGAFPPPDTAPVLMPLAARRVPAERCADSLIAEGRGDEAIRMLVDALKAAGVHPSNAPEAPPAPQQP
jgi:hypothetical protein